MNGYRTWIEISSEALTHNVHALKSCLSNDVTFFGVVKSNAYGHGLNEVVRILDRSQIKHFAVDSIEEAVLVRKILPNATVITLGFIPDEQMRLVPSYDIQPTVYDTEQLTLLETEAARIGKNVKIHVKIETGTSRQGVFPDNLSSFVRDIEGHKHLECIGMSTHFASAENLVEAASTNTQRDLFYETVGSVADAVPSLKYVHAACSAAILSDSGSHGTAVRAGISLYGLWPSPEVELYARQEHQTLRLHPALSWYSQIAQIKDYSAGTPIGYGGTEVLNRPTRVAVVPVGYYDGYDRQLSSRGDVLVRGQRCKVLGRICMNMMMIDASRVPSIARGDRVTLIGQDGAQRIDSRELADRSETIHWEVVSRISQHLPRIVV